MRFEEIYARYFKQVYSFALALSRNTHTAEEIMQETFFKAMKNPDAFVGRSSVSTYLCAIAHNLYVSSLRKRRHETDDAVLETIPDDTDIENALIARFLHSRSPLCNIFAHPFRLYIQPCINIWRWAYPAIYRPFFMVFLSNQGWILYNCCTKYSHKGARI